MRKVPRHMIRIRRVLEIRLMTRIAICRRARVARLTVQRVTLRAGNAGVRSRERESREIVIERRRLPAAGGVTHRAVMSEVARHVIWICRARKIRFMTREARLTRTRKILAVKSRIQPARLGQAVAL